MSRVDTSSSGDEFISPVASPQPIVSKSSRSLAIEPQASARGPPATRRATSRPLKRPGICSPSPARTQADSPASSYRSARPAFPPIEKWTVASLRQALANSDIQAPRKSTKAELYELYKNLKPTTRSTKTTTKATRKSKHTASPRWTPHSSSRSNTSSRRAPDSGTRPSASQSRAPDFTDARPAKGPDVAQPYGTAFQPAMPITQTGFWPPPPPVPAQQPTPFCPEPAAQVNAWPQRPAYVAPQPSPGPVAQASTWPQWPPNPIPQSTPLSSGPITQVDTGPHGPQNIAPPAAYNTLLQTKSQYSLFTATPMPVPANAIATEPPQAAHNIRAQILAGADVDLSSLLSLLPTADSNRQIDCGDFSVTLKNPNPLSSRILSFPEFCIAFSRFTEIICSVFPHRRRELNDYLAVIAELIYLAVIVLWRRAFLYVPQTVLRKMRGASRTVESMPLLGRTRPRSPQQGVLRLQEHRMCRVPINRPHHRKLPTDQSLSSSVPRTHLREIHQLRPETSNRRVPRLRTTSSIRGGQQAVMLFIQQPEVH